MDGIGWAASAMSAARARLDIAAENLANSSTDGFHRTLAHGVLGASGVQIERMRDASAGAMRHTGRALDVAIAGPGAFRLRDSGGRITLTRNGSFVRDRFGRLTDDGGRVLLDRSGRAIRLHTGANIEEALRGIALPHGSTLHAGFLEASNVNAIGEMIDVLCAQRSFESAEKILTAVDKTRERAATQVAQLK